MTGLSELLDAAADRAAPPSRLTADDIYRAGRRRLRHRRAAVSTVVLAALAATLGLGSAYGRTAAPPVGGPPGAGPVVWAGAGDNLHLYVLRQTCVQTDCGTELMVSTNEGRDWQSRGLTPPARSLGVLGPEILIVDAPAQADDPYNRFSVPEVWEQITFDGGRTWQPTIIGTEPLDSIEPGLKLISWGGAFNTLHPDALFGPDPATRTLRRLANVPDLDNAIHNGWNPAGTMFVTGTDPVSGVVTIAVSHSSGRSWTNVALPDAVPATPVQVFTANGIDAYALFRPSPQSTVLYRSSDAGQTWTRLTLAIALDVETAFVTGTGAVALRLGPPRQMPPAWLTTSGNDEPIKAPLEGLPAVAMPEMVTGGGYLAFDSEGAYFSVAGLAWHRIFSTR